MAQIKFDLPNDQLNGLESGLWIVSVYASFQDNIFIVANVCVRIHVAAAGG
jgi:hypothetical protein